MSDASARDPPTPHTRFAYSTKVASPVFAGNT